MSLGSERERERRKLSRSDTNSQMTWDVVEPDLPDDATAPSQEQDVS